VPGGSKFTGSASLVKGGDGPASPAVIQKELLMQALVNKYNLGQFEGRGIISQNGGAGKRKMIHDQFL